MTTEIALTAESPEVDQAMQWLMRLPQLPPNDLPVAEEIERVVGVMCKPCDATWCMARVAALLSPYYDKDTPPAVRKMEAEDWLEELKVYPQWAIERAVRWWKSADNKDRRKKPLEGDIADRCKVEMRGINAVPSLVERRRSGTYYDKQDARSERCTPDRAAEIMAQAGFTPKRFGHD